MQSLSNEDSAPGAESNVRWTGLRLFVVERMPLDATSQHHVAKWVMSEAEARGLDAELVGADGLSQLTEAGLAGGAIALIMVYPVSSDWGSIDSAVPWEAWSQLTSAAAELGATVALVDAGLRPAGVAMCLKNGASAVVPVDRVREALDLLSERSEASLGCDVSLGAVLGERFSDERIDRLTRLTTIELRVLYFLVGGYPACDIATMQRMALSTVRAHIRSILRKLNVKSQIAAVALANGTALPDSAPHEDSDGLALR